MLGLGLRVPSVGFWVLGVGFRVQGTCRVQVAGLGAQGLGAVAMAKGKILGFFFFFFFITLKPGVE